MPGWLGQTAPDHLAANNNKSAAMNLPWILPNDSLYSLRPASSRSGQREAALFLPEIAAVAGINIP
jgi:hypothetical protein